MYCPTVLTPILIPKTSRSCYSPIVFFYCKLNGWVYILHGLQKISKCIIFMRSDRDISLDVLIHRRDDDTLGRHSHHCVSQKCKIEDLAEKFWSIWRKLLRHKKFSGYAWLPNVNIFLATNKQHIPYELQKIHRMSSLNLESEEFLAHVSKLSKPESRDTTATIG